MYGDTFRTRVRYWRNRMGISIFAMFFLSSFSLIFKFPLVIIYTLCITFLCTIFAFIFLVLASAFLCVRSKYLAIKSATQLKTESKVPVIPATPMGIRITDSHITLRKK